MKEFLSYTLLSCYKELCMEEGIFDDNIPFESNEKKEQNYKYLVTNGLFIYDEILFYELYTYIIQIANPDKDKFSLLNIIKFLKKNYLSYNKHKKPKEKITNFLESNEIEEIKFRFINDQKFGLDLLETTFYKISDINKED